MGINFFSKNSAGHQRKPETFEEHLERMKAFRQAHDLAAGERGSPAPAAPTAGIKTPAEELQQILPTLVKIGYLLNLLKESGSAFLPRNWQN